MTFLEFAENIGPAKFAILCFFVAVAFIAAFYIAVKVIKELSFKVGGVAVSMKNDEQKKDIVNLVFEYGYFQDQMNDTRDLAVECLHKQAKRYTKLQLVQYLQKLRSEYSKVLEPTISDSKQITNVIFNMFTNELKGSMFSYMIEIYEKNHLAAKSDAELKAMAHDHYGKLADLFKDHAASIWIPVLQPYSQVRDISQDIAPFVEGLVFDILVYYKCQSETRNRVFEAARRISEGVKERVSKDLRLPDNARYLAENFYTEQTGLDMNLIGEFIEEM